MSNPVYGRYHIAEPPHNLISFHFHDGAVLKEVDWEPPIGVLDQSDLVEQGIYTDELVKGAKRVDALGSCTGNTAIEALSQGMTPEAFDAVPDTLGALQYTGPLDLNTQVLEECAILVYHNATDLTGNSAEEWPPTDCGSSGAYIVQFLEGIHLVTGQRIAHGADNLVSLMQSGGVMMGTPFAYAWETPGADGMIDGDGSVTTVMGQLAQIAGGHEIFLSAIEKLVLYRNGDVNPWETIIRFRNHWTASWGDNGSGRAHLSTFTHILGAYTDFRQVLV